MNTDDVIDRLARSTAPVSRSGALTRSAFWIAAGSLTALVMLVLTLGLRPDLDIAMKGAMFWTKLSYTASIAVVAMLATLALTRPESAPQRSIWLVLIPVAALAAYCLIEASRIDRALWVERWLGSSWQLCSLVIFMLALPIAAAFAIALRQFAPTHLRVTGALAGLAAGALSATLYAFHCPESGPAFVFTWYSIGIVLAMLAGALAGPRLLRW